MLRIIYKYFTSFFTQYWESFHIILHSRQAVINTGDKIVCIIKSIGLYSNLAQHCFSISSHPAHASVEFSLLMTEVLILVEMGEKFIVQNRKEKKIDY